MCLTPSTSPVVTAAATSGPAPLSTSGFGRGPIFFAAPVSSPATVGTTISTALLRSVSVAISVSGSGSGSGHVPHTTRPASFLPVFFSVPARSASLPLPPLDDGGLRNYAAAFTRLGLARIGVNFPALYATKSDEPDAGWNWSQCHIAGCALGARYLLSTTINGVYKR